MTSPAPRIALLGFSIECNRFAPPAGEADFLKRAYAAGPELLAELRARHPRTTPEMPAFVAAGTLSARAPSSRFARLSRV